MARGRRKVRRLENIEVIDLGDKGRAIGRAPDGRIVLVEKAVPGDIVTARCVQRKKGMWIMKPETYHQYSADRAEPFCSHFDLCGGCKWQNLDYERQLHFKEKAVRDALTRISGLTTPEILPIVGGEQTRFYRNKLEFTFSSKRWLTEDEISNEEIIDRDALGFHIPGLFDKIVDIEKCFLQPEPANAIRNRVRELAKEYGMTFQDIRERTGLLRNLIIRNNEKGEFMIILVVSELDKEAIDHILGALRDEFPSILSLYYCVNSKPNDSIFDLPLTLYAGQEHLHQHLGHVRFKVGPKSFFQTNPAQAKVLFDITREMASITSEELVFDLYCGIGSISLYVAEDAMRVVGIEEVPEAIEDARANAELNGIANTDFFAGDVKKVIGREEIRGYGRPDVIISDPPRAGMHQKVVESILGLSPRRVVYVSCNPSTQARDIKLLSDAYTLVKARPVDMFPHTSHIENVVLLERR